MNKREKCEESRGEAGFLGGDIQTHAKMQEASGMTGI